MLFSPYIFGPWSVFRTGRSEISRASDRTGPDQGLRQLGPDRTGLSCDSSGPDRTGPTSPASSDGPKIYG